MSKDKVCGFIFPEHMLSKCRKISSLTSPCAHQRVGIAPYLRRGTCGPVAQGLVKAPACLGRAVCPAQPLGLLPGLLFLPCLVLLLL